MSAVKQINGCDWLFRNPQAYATGFCKTSPELWPRRRWRCPAAYLSGSSAGSGSPSRAGSGKMQSRTRCGCVRAVSDAPETPATSTSPWSNRSPAANARSPRRNRPFSPATFPDQLADEAFSPRCTRRKRKAAISSSCGRRRSRRTKTAKTNS